MLFHGIFPVYNADKISFSENDEVKNSTQPTST